jgi:hypothetical protein
MFANEKYVETRLLTKNMDTMKRIIVNNRILVIVFFTVFSVNQGNARVHEGNQPLPVSFRYNGQVNNHPLYKLVVSGNSEPDEFTIIIRGNDDNVLFRENIKGENFTKSFLLNTDELGDESLYVEIVSKRTKRSQAYEINRYSHLEEEVVLAGSK